MLLVPPLFVGLLLKEHEEPNVEKMA